MWGGDVRVGLSIGLQTVATFRSGAGSSTPSDAIITETSDPMITETGDFIVTE